MLEAKLVNNFSSLTKRLDTLKKKRLTKVLEIFGQQGVKALSAATPVDTGLTASSWYYKIEVGENVSTIKWCNSNVHNGVPIAIILQYGHGTGTGGYVQGTDYINPAMKPVFESIKEKFREEVMS